MILAPRFRRRPFGWRHHYPVQGIAPNLHLDRGPGIRRTLEMLDPIPLTVARLQGHFTVELIDAATGLVRRRLEFPNLVTNAALDAIGNGAGLAINNMASFLAVGTGSVAPAFTDTALAAQTGVRTSADGGQADTNGFTAGPPEFYWRRRTREFTEAESNGNLTECGLFSALTGGTMFCRQLFRDAGGTPTTVVKTSSDRLRVTYELRSYPDTTDGSLARTISGSAYTVTVRPVNQQNVGTAAVWSFGGAGTFPWEFAASTLTARAASAAAETNTLRARNIATGRGDFGTTAQPNGANAIAAYTAGTRYRDFTQIWEPAVANYALGIGTIGGMELGGLSSPSHQLVWSPRLPKTSVRRLTLVLRFAWDRFTI